MKLSAVAQEVVERGKVEIKVRRAGALQRIEFSAKRPPIGNMQYLVLFTDRFVDLGELVRVAEEVGLPIFAANGKVFPKGKTAADFVGL